MISNIWMKTEKIINLDWKQNRSTNLSVLAFGILNAEPIPLPQERDHGAQEGPLRWPREKGAPGEGRLLKKRAPLCKPGMGRDEIKGYEKHEEYKSKRPTLLEPGALRLEGNSFSSTENPVINPGYQGKGVQETQATK